MGQEVGDSWLAWAWGPPGDACIANSPSGFCKGAAFFGFVTTPPPQFANCKLRQSQLRLAKERNEAGKAQKQIRTGKALGRWDGLRKQGLDLHLILVFPAS